jgi:sterol desaturase/sphingolipid hydroxylase (fatty acid hydroxylase superfamily)
MSEARGAMSMEDSRLWVFVALWLLLALAEARWSAGGRQTPVWLRWRRHLGLAALNTLLLRVIAPGGAIAAALWAAEHDKGLLHQFELATIWDWVVTLLVFDFAIYWQHRIFHSRPFWLLHAVHHSDTDFDLSTGVRFHPFEILLSMILKMLLAVALGAPAEAILLFEIILSGMALFTHADLRIPDRIDHALRWVIVTPNMHRIHHSTRRFETDSNFSNALSIWDRLCRSYTRDAKEGMQIGLEQHREPDHQRLRALLQQPFAD